MASVQNHNGSPTIFIDGKPVFGAMVMTDKVMTPWNGQPNQYFVSFYNAGYRLFQVDIGGSASFDGAYDGNSESFSHDAFDCFSILKEYSKLYPDAKFLLRVVVESRNPEGAWLKNNPGQFEKWGENTSIAWNPCTSYASEAGLRDGKRYLCSMMEAIESYNLQNSILGFLICASYSSEWCKYSAQADVAADYSEPMQEYFRSWIKEKYSTDSALRMAWGDDSVTLDSVTVPSPDDQRACDLGIFRDPVKRGCSIDYFESLAHLTARNIIELCRCVKEYRKDYLAGAFYGYVLDSVANQGFYSPGKLDVDHTWGARSGHGGLAEVLASDHVDFLASPYRYDFRGMGGEGGFRTALETVRRAGKLWFDEIDIRTCFSDEDSGYGQAKDVYETIQLLRRQYSNILTHSCAAWLCDWCTGERGCFDDEAIMEECARFLRLGTKSLEMSHRSSDAEIAIVGDARGQWNRSFEIDADIQNFYSFTWQIPRIGAPADYIIIDDITEGRAREYKLYIMIDSCHITPEQREKLNTAADRNHAVILWCHAAGISDGKTLSADNIYKTTGIKVKLHEGRWSMKCYLTDYSHPITKNLPQTTYWGSDRFFSPLMSGDDSDATVLGNVVFRQGRCEPGLLIKESNGHTSVWSAAQGLPAALIRNIAEYAGVHIYSSADDVLYCGDGYLMLHSLKKGCRTISLPYMADVYDCVSNEKIASESTQFTADMTEDSTVLYRITAV